MCPKTERLNRRDSTVPKTDEPSQCDNHRATNGGTVSTAVPCRNR
jgi:hypothetical protein